MSTTTKFRTAPTSPSHAPHHLESIHEHSDKCPKAEARGEVHLRELRPLGTFELPPRRCRNLTAAAHVEVLATQSGCSQDLVALLQGQDLAKGSGRHPPPVQTAEAVSTKTHHNLHREKDCVQAFVSHRMRFRSCACFSSQGNFTASRGDPFPWM